MQPYQKASEALRSGEEYPLHLLKNAGLAAIGTGATSLGFKAVNKLVPAIGALINEFVPENLSIAGLKKVDPRFGKFIQGALDEGYTYEDIRGFIGDKVKKSQEPAQEKKNIIEQYSPELHKWILGEIQNGRSPVEAAALAQNDQRFEKIIKKMTKEHKTQWSNIIQSVYGLGEKAQQPQQQQAFQQQPIGQGQQALMQILQKINQKLGG